MKKNRINDEVGEISHLLKLLRIMKITCLLLLVTLVQISASTYSQSTKLTLDLKNTKLSEFIIQIEKTSEFRFFYEDAKIDLSKEVTLTVENSKVDEVLDILFKDLNISYEIFDRYIILKNKGMGSGIEKSFTQQQQKNVTGQVVDTSGQPLAGVTVILKGTTVGTITDGSGNYSLSNISVNATLQFSFVGMKTQEFSVFGKSTIDVIMKEESVGIDEVVAVGYGTLKRSSIVSSMSSVRGKDLIATPLKSVDQMLQGQASGVMVRQSEGSPGAEAMIRIRGANSIMGSNEALIVVDGLQRASLSNIDYQTIESIEILKGSNATAIFGSEGANGVILITTKSGKKDQKPEINISSSIYVSKVDKTLDLMDAATYAKYKNAYKLANNLNLDPLPIFSPQQIEEFEKTGGTDWQDEIFRSAISHNHSVSINGGTDKVNYWFSGSYLSQSGILINSGFDRYLFSSKLNADITDWLTVGVNYSYTDRKASKPYTDIATDRISNPIDCALKYSPTVPVYNDLGGYAYATGEISIVEGNPVAEALEPVNDINIYNNSLNAFLRFDILDGLTLTINGGAMLDGNKRLEFLNNYTALGKAANGIGRINNTSRNYFQNSNILTYDNWFKKHHLTVTGVVEQKNETFLGSYITNTSFSVQQTGMYAAGSAAVQKASSAHWERFMLSYLGRINYEYDNKYFLNLSYRADGSSVFGKNNKWGYFPSAGIGWRLSEESFIADMNLFDNLMLRSSWGVTGNQAISPYQTLATIAIGSDYPYNGGDANIIGFQVTNAANPDLKWEETFQKDFGIDVSFFKGKLSLSAEYYEKLTKNLLMSRNLPSVVGLASVIDNVGEIKNRGFEFTVDHSVALGTNFTMKNNFNISFNKTFVVDLGESDKLGYSASTSGHGVNGELIWLFEGEEWGNIYGWGYEGTWKTDELAEALRYGQMPGDPHYTDLNDDGIINTLDRKFIGNVTPDFIYGLNSQMTYKNFGLSIKIQGSQGNDLFSTTRLGSNLTEHWTDIWTEDNQNTNVPAIIDAKTRKTVTEGHPSTISFPTSMENANSRWIEDGSYIRLKNLQFSYNLPVNIIKRVDFKNMRIYVSGENLITLTRYQGYNPEESAWTDDKRMGTSSFGYPIPKIFLLGLDITF